MTLLGWIRGRRGDDNGRKLDMWRNKWQGASAAPDAAAVVALTADLESLGLPEEEIVREDPRRDSFAADAAARVLSPGRHGQARETAEIVRHHNSASRRPPRSARLL